MFFWLLKMWTMLISLLSVLNEAVYGIITTYMTLDTAFIESESNIIKVSLYLTEIIAV